MYVELQIFYLIQRLTFSMMNFKNVIRNPPKNIKSFSKYLNLKQSLSTYLLVNETKNPYEGSGFPLTNSRGAS